MAAQQRPDVFDIAPDELGDEDFDVLWPIRMLDQAPVANDWQAHIITIPDPTVALDDRCPGCYLRWEDCSCDEDATLDAIDALDAMESGDEDPDGLDDLEGDDEGTDEDR